MSGEREIAKQGVDDLGRLSLPTQLQQASDLVALSTLGFVFAVAVEHFGWGSAIDTFLVWCFAATIALVLCNAFQYTQNADDGLGVLLAMLLAISATIMIVILMVAVFYHLPESPLFVKDVIQRVLVKN